MSIVITERAATEVKKILDDQKYEEGTFLRVGVTGGGCSGFSYALGFDKEYDQHIFYLDDASLGLINQKLLDFYKN